MYRYSNIKIEKIGGKRAYKTVIYPQIEPLDDDIYIITTSGDRLDSLANIYYKDPTLWWIISCANNIPYDSLYPTTGIQLRIPMDITNILNKFNEINNIR